MIYSGFDQKFIEILAVVGVVEYLLTFLVNRFVLPNVLLYFSGVEENPLLLGSGVIFFLSAVLMLLILGALNAMFPSPLHEMVQAALEQMQKISCIPFPLEKLIFLFMN